MSELMRRIESDIVSTMKSEKTMAQQLKLAVLRMIKSNVKNKEVELRRPLNDGEVEGVLTSMSKKHKESIEQFTKGNRDDLVTIEDAQLAHVESYLPKEADESQMNKIIDNVISYLQTPPTKQDMGKIMTSVKDSLSLVSLRADGKKLSELVRAKLS